MAASLIDPDGAVICKVYGHRLGLRPELKSPARQSIGEGKQDSPEKTRKGQATGAAS